ncbi:hypothetical protein [Ramlibacter rhizophilus]|uniref:Uncharacterized protein n=1 Tax=Ramlibacter rhizophilus TaxID=1781167 RepID=A0A4Z0BZ26_9BURK|nr:hypothetical protein [Ramlibacter rhizophilus]TFZ04221.1 hypothetical protein EZ242_00190 [Ramlibacter rhizophilus]
MADPVASFAGGPEASYSPGEAVAIRTDPTEPGDVVVEVDGIRVEVLHSATPGTPGDSGAANTGGEPDASTGSTGETGGNTGELIVVLPADLTPGTHALTLTIRGKTITLQLEVGNPSTGGSSARDLVASLIEQAVAQLQAHLAQNPGDTAAAALLAQLTSAAQTLEQMTDAEVEALYQQLMANALPPSDLPGSCVAAKSNFEARMKAMLRSARLAAWLAQRHAENGAKGSNLPVLLAQARMEEATRRVLAYAAAASSLCGEDSLTREAERGSRANGRSNRAAAGGTR